MKAIRLLIILISQLTIVSGLWATGSISGTITDAATGAPVMGAIVQARYAEKPQMSVAFSAKSDSLGHYRIENIPNDKFNVYAIANGFMLSEPKGPYAVNNNETTGVDFKLKALEGQDVTLSGFVREFAFDTSYAKSLSFKPVYPAKITIFTFSATGDSIIYSTKNNPDGSYSINSITPGVYRLVCEAEGYQRKYVTNVRLLHGNLALDIFMTKIYSSSISGRVIFDKTGLPVENAHILIFSSTGSGYGISVYTDSQGYYSTDVPEGNYVVSCTKIDHGYFYTEFYDNVQSLAEAKVLYLSAGTTLKDISFGLPDYKTNLKVLIKGTVKDDKGNPVPYATVKVWFRYINDSLKVFTNDPLARFIAVTADASGNYSIDFSKSAGMVNWVILSAEKENYQTEFYNNKPSFYQATPICITKDTLLTGIDFSLTPASAQNIYSISGTVTGSQGAALNGAFVIGTSSSRSGEIILSITDKDGKYTLANLKEGKYYLLFAAHGYIPEFFNNAYRWESAQPINVSSNVSGIDAELKAIRPDSGRCFISGIIKSRDGSIITGALVIIKNSSGEAVSSSITDGTGSYQISGLYDGTYTLQASKVNYQSVEVNVSVNTALPEQVTNLSMSQTLTSVEGDRNIIPTEIKLIGNYPNPFNPSTKISFSLPAGQFTTLKVYNMLGQEVAVLLNEKLDAGNYNIGFNAGQLSSGIYLYELRAGSYSSVKKMVLAK